MKAKRATAKQPGAYAQAGVDIDLGNQAKAALPELLDSTRRPEVLGKIGGFGGLFAFDTRKYRQPVLVSSVDGVGTKLKIAFAMNRHDTIGQDLVNHCVNDIAVLGAEPLFFLDYLGTGKLDPRVFVEIVGGFAKACAENRCALVGGETAQMPGFYRSGEYDVSGTIVGVAEKQRLLTGATVRPGDAMVGIASNGLHTNGYSLARRVFFEQMKLKPSSRIADLAGSVGDELLKVHVSYGPLLAALLRRFNRDGAPPVVKAAAHITGGGFCENIPRVLPRNCRALIWKGAWDILPVFRLIAGHGRVAEAEMYRVFNMGIGLVLIAGQDRIDAVLRAVRSRKHKAWVIGEIARGSAQVELVER